jgi:carbon monoxide dehydrogenase subunit G
MASIRREVTIEAAPDAVWDALRDVGAIHTRLAKGFVTDVHLNGDTRTVTFGNGMVVDEIVLGVDEDLRRVAWTARGGRLTHHNASAQVFSEGPKRTRFVWIADLLPNEMAPAIAGMIEAGLAAVKRTLEG